MRILIALIAACILPSICNGAGSNAFIADCSDFKIIVEDFDETGTLTANYLKSKAEFLCRRNGLPVKDDGARPFLYILPTVGELSSGKFVCNTRVSFSVWERGQFIEVWASRNTVGYFHNSIDLQRALTEQVQNSIEKFYNVWMASHPKEKPAP